MNLYPLTATHPLPDGRAHLLGAVSCVTGSMTRIETGGRALLVDCGIGQGKEASHARLPDAACDVDAVFLTHGHLDHVGAIPALLDRGYDGPLFGTDATLSIADLVLTDSIHLEGGSDADIDRFRRRFKELALPVRYDQPVRLPGFDGTVAFREAGHILGSASVELQTPRSRVICSGDLGRPDSPILRDYCETWRPGQPVDLVVLETTYGDREHAHTHGDVEHELERVIRRAVSTGGHVLVPAFAIGRTQTLLYHLNSLVEARRVPNILVAVDTPLGLKVTDLYEHSRDLFDRDALDRIARGDDPLDFHDLFAVHRARDSARLRDVKEPMLIIAGSGMCTGGRILGHLHDLLPREETCVLFVGFQAPGTPGALIQRARRGAIVHINGEDVPVRATIETLSGLSAHADRRELLRWLRAIPGVERVGLNHGEPRSQQAFANWASACLEHSLEPTAAVGC